VTPHSAR